MTSDLDRYRNLAVSMTGLLNFDNTVRTIALLLHEYGHYPQPARQEIVGEAILLVAEGIRRSVTQEDLGFTNREISDITNAAILAALDMLSEISPVVGHC